ncbi:uncharacterized protein LOC129574774 [Sitodiplosis mosellana]|uniref:uncharacterized protein LOC129574774 n=1 Tax=Sitodiplosis mosellana TaxID=263140 RepID=UPI00244464E3|nr:uncharacterized protein LOC129574774 [Sitodiplosis mosellana]
MKEDCKKTQDVELTEDVTFRDMMLKQQVLAGLTKCNFIKPSPIQMRAIPIGRCGLDLIIQSKSGTGKTLVFCTIILERYDPQIKTPQSLIVVPTREIALQVESYLSSIGSSYSGFSVASVIGGRDIVEDRKRISKCKAIVGTPGRILHLIKNNYVCLQNIQTFVLDEADKLVSDDFYGDINKFLNALNKNRQIIASSATYADDLDKLIVSFMHNPIAVSTSRDTAVLIGVKQFILPVTEFALPSTVQNSTASIQAMRRKVAAVEYILSTTSFKQCILFSNSQLRANSYANYLTQMEWTVELVIGSHDQETRTATLQKFRQYKSRILITSDLMARGVDIVNVNLVINLDVPGDSSTYLHRIGRCGRFGRRGLAITLASDDAEMEKFRKLLGIIGGSKMKVATFPTTLNGGANFDAWNSTDESQPDDSYVFGAIDEEKPIEAKQAVNEELHNGQEKQTSKHEAEKDTIESKNLNLLEVARLLIDTDSTPNDLFSSYQNSTDNTPMPDVTISTDIFDDFAQFQCNGNAEQQDDQGVGVVEKDEHEAKEERFESVQEKKEISFDEMLTTILKQKNYPGDDHEHGNSFGDQQQENTLDDHLPPNVADKEEMPKSTGLLPVKKSNHESNTNRKSRKNAKQHENAQANRSELPMPNDFWIQTYWNQLRDINKYVAHSNRRYK